MGKLANKLISVNLMKLRFSSVFRKQLRANRRERRQYPKLVKAFNKKYR